MAKQLNTLESTRLLFEHNDIVFKLIEAMDRENVRYVREHDLNSTILEYIRHRSKVEKERIRAGFHPQNLFRAGLIIDIDKAHGERRLVFHESLLNLMRACNASLHQELTDARLRGYLVNLRDVYDRLRGSSCSEQDPDFTELRDDLTQRISQLIGLLRENVRRMQTISSDLADMSLDASKTPEAYTEYRRELYERITVLYERHIRPTLVFLNRNTKLKDGPNLFATLDDIRQILDQNDQYDIADQIHRSALSLNAMYKPIEAVSTEIEHFLRKTQRGMLEYNAMEQAYDVLVALKDETETKNMRRKWLDGGDFVRSSGFVLGLKAHTRPKQYAFGQSQSYFNLLFSEIDQRLQEQNRESEKPVLVEDGHSIQDQKIDTKRVNALFEWVDSLELRPTSDLVYELHTRLQGFIEGYRFPDLLAVLSRLGETSSGHRIVTTNRFKVMESPQADEEDDVMFVYRKRRLVPLNSESENA